jgi:hypothetical protein
VVVKCPDVSEKHTGSIFRVTELALWKEGNVLVTLSGLREFSQSQLHQGQYLWILPLSVPSVAVIDTAPSNCPSQMTHFLVTCYFTINLKQFSHPAGEDIMFLLSDHTTTAQCRNTK